MPSALILLSSTPSSTKLAPGAKLQDVDTYHTVVRCSIAPRLKVHREFYAKIIPPSAPKITIDERWRTPCGEQYESDERECKIAGRPQRN
jgi:hypothetical protein